MSVYRTVVRVLFGHHSVPAVLYAAFVIAMLFVVTASFVDVVDRHQSVLRAAEVISHFERRATDLGHADVRTPSMPPGSPFLEGETETEASAAILQRVTSAISAVGGSVVSSEVEASEESRETQRFLRVTATSEIEQKSLQPLLYDLEAGMPFLFLSQVVAQAQPDATAGGKLRVVLGVSGLWVGK
jgi:general secretion pathway protein M